MKCPWCKMECKTFDDAWICTECGDEWPMLEEEMADD